MSRSVAERLAELEALGSVELRSRWQEAFGRPAPKHTGRDLLLRALAYRVQEQAERGLSKIALKRLAALADPQRSGGRSPRPSAACLEPGTRLVREWRGEIHQVSVRDDGFAYRGEHFTSLSRIARTITGTRWSGPLFFGLRRSGERPGTSADA